MTDFPLQNIIKSYRLASQLAVQRVRDLSVSLEGKADEEKKDLLRKCASTTLNSKLVGTGNDDPTLKATRHSW